MPTLSMAGRQADVQVTPDLRTQHLISSWCMCTFGGYNGLNVLPTSAQSRAACWCKASMICVCASVCRLTTVFAYTCPAISQDMGESIAAWQQTVLKQLTTEDSDKITVSQLLQKMDVQQ